jgi:hypothetical protein
MTYYCQNAKDHKSGKPMAVKRETQICPFCGRILNWQAADKAAKVAIETCAVYPIGQYAKEM